MKHTHGEEALVLVLLACLTACTDPVTTTTGPSISPDVKTAASYLPSPERAALTKIARLVAVSMDNEPAT